jgi:hypothetical protein
MSACPRSQAHVSRGPIPMRFNLFTQLLSTDAIAGNAPDSMICPLLREIISSSLEYLEFPVQPWAR